MKGECTAVNMYIIIFTIFLAFNIGFERVHGCEIFVFLSSIYVWIGFVTYFIHLGQTDGSTYWFQAIVTTKKRNHVSGRVNPVSSSKFYKIEIEMYASCDIVMQRILYAHGVSTRQRGGGGWCGVDARASVPAINKPAPVVLWQMLRRHADWSNDVLSPQCGDKFVTYITNLYSNICAICTSPWVSHIGYCFCTLIEQERFSLEY